MQKFDFSIQTRDGQKVDSIVIAGRDEAEAERKLRQMYRYCEIVSCNSKQADSSVGGQQTMSVEDILSLISK
jgi:type II secretory pathway component PulF